MATSSIPRRVAAQCSRTVTVRGLVAWLAGGAVAVAPAALAASGPPVHPHGRVTGSSMVMVLDGNASVEATDFSFGPTYLRVTPGTVAVTGKPVTFSYRFHRASGMQGALFSRPATRVSTLTTPPERSGS